MPRSMVQQTSSLGSSTLTTWKRRASAGSFSKYFLYSDHVVAAIVRSSPRASAGFRRLAASFWPAVSARANHGVRFVDEEDDLFGRRLDLVDQSLQAILKLALDAGAGLQQRKVQRVDMHALERRRNIARRDPVGKSFDHRGLAHASLAGQDRVVLPPAHQDVDHLAHLGIAAQHRIDLARLGVRRKVHGVLVQMRRLARPAGAGPPEACRASIGTPVAAPPRQLRLALTRRR